jgi:pyruvate dehydrogenase E2 component (dihydrolipoamide acetyltransferase)
MPIDILMPALSPTMTEGTLARWLKKEGETVKAGQVIAEIETDKATMEVEAVDEGIIGKILIGEGTEGVPVNKLIAVLLEDGEDKAAIDSYVAGKGGATSAPASASSAPAATASSAAQPTAVSSSAAEVHTSAANGKYIASPLAKRIAAMEGVSLSGIEGTGPHGRIIKADVEEAMKGGSAKKSQATNFVASSSYGRNPVEYQEISLNTMRKTIAKRLLESKQTIPHFYLTVECRIDDLMEARAKINDAAPKDKDGKPAYKLTLNDFVIKASALALRDVPEANASWQGNVVHQYNNVDISVAVAIDGGLITPIVRNADQKSISAISAEMKDLAARAKANKLAPEEFQGGGFSISNLGMYGVKQFNAIVNPPQSAILAVGAGEEKLVMEKGAVKAINVMNVTLSSDHRVVDGAVGAVLLSAFRRYIENPVMMVV